MDKLIEILEDIRPDINFEIEEPLIDGGVLESIDVATLVGEINFTFNIEIAAEDITPENFNTVEAIWDLISSMQE